MKKISILIPCYNEEENVGPMSEAIVNLFTTQLSNYDYELLFIDNHSRQENYCEVYVQRMNILKQSSMLKILDSSTLHIMEYYRQQEIAPSVWCVIFRILSN